DSGQAGVRFAFNDSGSITSVTVVRSSGNPKVDDAAVALIRKASPIPAPPDGAPRSHTITIQFR
ncbi:energy transducer TonB, partial [Salmonella enterica subsp. enterica serovar Virchow]|nr:energy transducer TonB [Salmonella enterica subsp. enterica serovar Virchow]